MKHFYSFFLAAFIIGCFALASFAQNVGQLNSNGNALAILSKTVIGPVVDGKYLKYDSAANGGHGGWVLVNAVSGNPFDQELNTTDAATFGNLTVGGTVTAPLFVGNVTGTASAVSTIPNLTGSVTSSGTTTALASATLNVLIPYSFNSSALNILQSAPDAGGGVLSFAGIGSVTQLWSSALDTLAIGDGTALSVSGNALAGLFDGTTAITPNTIQLGGSASANFINGTSGSLLMTDGDVTSVTITGFLSPTLVGVFDDLATGDFMVGNANFSNIAETAANDGQPLHGTDNSTSGIAAFEGDGSLGQATGTAGQFIDGTGAFQDISSIAATQKVVTNATPTTGQTVNATGVHQDELIYIQPAGTLLALTVQLEPGGGVIADIGDVKEIFISQIITGLTVSATGGTVRGTALTTSSAVNGSYEYIKVTSTDWLRIR